MGCRLLDSEFCLLASLNQYAFAGQLLLMEKAQPRPIKVSVLVDLARRPSAGGHVKSWERFAQAAARQADGLDLTVHFLGNEEAVEPLADNVRFCLHPPRFSTQRFSFLSHVPDHTDLAFYHPGLAKSLANCDVIHTTDAFFTFARTARSVTYWIVL